MDFISGHLISLTNPVHRIPDQFVNKPGWRLFCDRALSILPYLFGKQIQWFDSRLDQCMYGASRPPQGTVNGGAVSKWPRCWWDVKHKQTNKDYLYCLTLPYIRWADRSPRCLAYTSHTALPPCWADTHTPLSPRHTPGNSSGIPYILTKHINNH